MTKPELQRSTAKPYSLQAEVDPRARHLNSPAVRRFNDEYLADRVETPVSAQTADIRSFWSSHELIEDAAR
jgi:hypothetical protein